MKRCFIRMRDGTYLVDAWDNYLATTDVPCYVTPEGTTVRARLFYDYIDAETYLRSLPASVARCFFGAKIVYVTQKGKV